MCKINQLDLYFGIIALQAVDAKSKCLFDGNQQTYRFGQNTFAFSRTYSMSSYRATIHFTLKSYKNEFCGSLRDSVPWCAGSPMEKNSAHGDCRCLPIRAERCGDSWMMNKVGGSNYDRLSRSWAGCWNCDGPGDKWVGDKAGGDGGGRANDCEETVLSHEALQGERRPALHESSEAEWTQREGGSGGEDIGGAARGSESIYWLARSQRRISRWVSSLFFPVVFFGGGRTGMRGMQAVLRLRGKGDFISKVIFTSEQRWMKNESQPC